MAKPSVSLIIPVYKVNEAYFKQCIDSVLKQTFKNIEVILVDDGSPDESGKICDLYRNSDERVVVIHKDNGGVSSARNEGLIAAHGEWVMFLDADDWLIEYAIEEILREGAKYDADMICFNHFYNSDDRQWKREHITPKTIVRCNNDLKWSVIDMLFPYLDKKRNNVQLGACRAVWGKLYKASIVREHNLMFDTDLKISEDAIFNMDFIAYAKKVVHMDKYLMHYRVHGESIMQRYNEDVFDINEKALTAYLKRIERYWKDIDFQIAYLGMASECVFRAMKMKILHDNCTLSFFEKRRMLKKLFSTAVYIKALNIQGYSYLPVGKKQIMMCIRYGLYIPAMFISWSCIKYLNKNL